MPSFLSRLQAAVSGQAPAAAPTSDTAAAPTSDSAADPAADPASGRAPADAAPPPVPADLAALLTGAPTGGPPEASATDPADGTVACWSLPLRTGTTALQLRDELRSRLPEPEPEPAVGGAPARWWPVVAVDDALEASLTHEPEPLAELSDLDVEEGPALLDRRWEAAADRAEREHRLGMHRGTTPAEVVAAVTGALVAPLEASADDAVAVVRAAAAWQLPAVLGWAPLDCGLSGRDLSAVLQYWEEQWGAELVALGAASLVLRVSDPPQTAEDATAVAQEVLAVAPGLVGGELVEPLPRAAELLAPVLRGAGWWRLDLA